MPASQTPHTVALYAHEDLVDKVKPGDRVCVTGIYRAVPLKLSNRMRTLKAIYKTYIDVLHFKYVVGFCASSAVAVDYVRSLAGFALVYHPLLKLNAHVGLRGKLLSLVQTASLGIVQ